jgi:hypothetical protein
MTSSKRVLISIDMTLPPFPIGKRFSECAFRTVMKREKKFFIAVYPAMLHFA